MYKRQVFDAAEARTVEFVGFADPAIATGATSVVTVRINLPAEAGGTVVSLLTVNGSIAATLTIPQGDLEATETFTAGNVSGLAEVTASIGASSATASINLIGDTGLVIAEVLYDTPGADAGTEWVKLYNGSAAPIDLSNYSLGNGGNDYTFGVHQLSGTIAAGGCFIVGGPISDADNGNPVYDVAAEFVPNLQNSGTTADGVALFDVVAANVDAATVPIDTVIYGTNNTNNLLDETGVAGTPNVGDAPSGQSLLRTGIATWVINMMPTPADCPNF